VLDWGPRFLSAPPRPSAAQQGSKRVRGEKVREGGGGSRILLLLLIAGVAFLFLNPRTGPEARRLVKEAVSSATSSGG